MKNFEIDKATDKEFELICEYIKLRYHSNISQRELAKKIGVAQSTIARMEKNLHSVSLRTFVKMLSALDHELQITKKKGDNNGTK